MAILSKVLSIQDSLRLANVKPQRKFRVSPNDSVKLPDNTNYYTQKGDYVFYSPNMKIFWLHTKHIVHEYVNLNHIVEELRK
jgi:hypothetical protein